MALVVSLLLPCGARAAAPGHGKTTAEYDLKAAFLFNFTQFVSWPVDAFPGADSSFVIAVLGDDHFGGSLDEIVAGGSVNHRKIVVRRYRAVEQVGGCQMMFICLHEMDRIDHILSALEHRSILTVGETQAFTARSGVIAFEMSQRRLRLRINVAAAKAAKLTISSKLLRQATIVGAGGTEP